MVNNIYQDRGINVIMIRQHANEGSTSIHYLENDLCKRLFLDTTARLSHVKNRTADS